MKISVLDGRIENPGDLSWEPLYALGEVSLFEDVTTDEDEIVNRIGDAEVVVLNKVELRKSVIERCPSIKMVAVLATGFDVVDIAYCAENGIPVCNVPSYGTDAVAQFAIALLLEICGHVSYHSNEVHSGRWSKSGEWCFWDYPLIELLGKTIGIIGFGRIGQKVGTIAKALGMNVIAYNRSQNESGRQIAEYVSLDELFARADVVSLHCPMSPEVKGIINKDNISKMKDGVIILNNSRGQLVVEQDLADALNSGKVFAAGVDVVSTEPIKEDNPLLSAQNCIITPHISWAAKECRQRILNTTVDNIKGYIDGKLQNVINMK